MKLYKNGIEVKYILLVIGIIAVSGIAVASTNIFFTDSGTSYLDALTVTHDLHAAYLYGDITNVTGKLPVGSASSNTVVTNPSAKQIITGQPLEMQNGDGGGYGIVNLVNPGTGAGNNMGMIVAGNGTGENARIIVGSGEGINARSWDFYAVSPSGVYINTVTMAANHFYLKSLQSASATPHTLCLNGNEVTDNAGTTCVVSNRSLKENFSDITKSDIDKLLLLNTEKFNFKKNNETQDKKHFGTTAQEVAVIYPELARYNKDGSLQTYEILEFIPLLIKQNQEQQKQINQLQVKNIEQQNQIDKIQYEIELLKGNTTATTPILITAPPETEYPVWMFWK